MRQTLLCKKGGRAPMFDNSCAIPSYTHRIANISTRFVIIQSSSQKPSTSLLLNLHLPPCNTFYLFWKHQNPLPWLPRSHYGLSMVISNSNHALFTTFNIMVSSWHFVPCKTILVKFSLFLNYSYTLWFTVRNMFCFINISLKQNTR